MSPVRIQSPLPAPVRWKHLTGTRQGFSIWPVGQVVKTRPFHGCNMGSSPVRVTNGGLAQLVRAPASHAGGHWFESSSLHQPQAIYLQGFAVFLFSRGWKRRLLQCAKNVRNFAPFRGLIVQKCANVCALKIINFLFILHKFDFSVEAL